MKRFYAFLCQAEMYIAKYALALLAVLVFAAAVARTLHRPLVWAMDVATFLFAWVVFLGADIALRGDRLFCIEILSGKLPPRAQLYLKVVNHVIMMVFLGGMIGYGSWLSYTTRLRAFQGIPGFSYTWVTISVPIGCLLMLITVILKIGQLLKAIRQPAPLERVEQRVSEII